MTTLVPAREQHNGRRLATGGAPTRSVTRGTARSLVVSFLLLAVAGSWHEAMAQRAETADGQQVRHGEVAKRADELQRRLSAEEFDPDAMFFLGVMAIQNRTTEGDYEEAAAWFGRAAEHGHPEALFNLGILYWTGQGVSRDRSRAVFYWRRAAELEFPAAQYNLAVAYMNGEGTAVDSREARYWLDRAATGGHKGAASALEVFDAAQ